MKARSERTKSGDWLEAGLTLLRDGGEDALTIDRLCARLGRTKGAFYHHFEDIGAYQSALLEAWANLHTELPIAVADEATTAVQRRKLLHQAVGLVDLGLELSVHAWAVRSASARATVERVHARRIAYLAELRAGQKNGRVVAELEYAAFLGGLHLHSRSPAKRLRLTKRMLEILAAASARAPR